MMSEIPLEGLGSESTYNEAAIESHVPPELPQHPVSLPISYPPPSGPSLSRRLSAAFCCPCGCDTSAQSTPLHQVQPVILRPTNDVYLELKPNRRLRVIHIPPGGFSQQSNGKKVHHSLKQVSIGKIRMSIYFCESLQILTNLKIHTTHAKVILCKFCLIIRTDERL
jgi:hypothetical protein